MHGPAVQPGRPAAAALDDVWGHAARSLWQRLGEAATLPERIGVLDQELRLRLGTARREDAAVLHASEVLAARHGGVSVDDPARAAGLGRRQLERRFLAVVGLPPRLAGIPPGAYRRSLTGAPLDALVQGG